MRFTTSLGIGTTLLPPVRAMLAGLVLVLTATAWAQEPGYVIRGTCLPADGRATPIQWKAQNLTASETAEALRLEVEPKVNGTADSAPLPLAPLHLYTMTITCRRGPGLGLIVWVKWLERRSEARRPAYHLAVAGPLPHKLVAAVGAQDHLRPAFLPARRSNARHAADRHDRPSRRRSQLLRTLRPDARPRRRGAVWLESGCQPVPRRRHGGRDRRRHGPGLGFLGPAAGRESAGARRPGPACPRRPALPGLPGGKSCILVDGTIPIEPGRAYRVSLWARGKGDIGLGAHALEAREGQRVADPQQVALRVESQDWQPFSVVWFAESLYAANANLFLGIHPQTSWTSTTSAFND